MAWILLSSGIFCIMLLSTMAWDIRHNLNIPRKFRVSRESTDVNYTKIINFWKDHKKELAFHGEHEDVVLVMGNTGAGKTTVISALIGRKLRSIEVDGYLIIIDEEGKIGTGSSSTTLIPEVMTDIKRNVTYVDCSGFRDNREVEYEISSIYFQNILMSQVKKIKLVLVINYDSLKINGNKNDFDDLFEHIGEFMEDISKFHDGIALVATKVENSYKKAPNGTFILSNDNESVLKGIMNYLKNKKETYLNKSENSKKYRIFANLIDVLMEKKNDLYTRVALFRQPTGEGLLENLPETKSQIDNIAKLTAENLHYIEKTSDDFGFALSKSLKNTIDQIVDDIYRDALMNCSGKMIIETLKHYSQIEQEYSDIEVLQKRVSRAYDVFSELKIANEPRELFKEFFDAINILNIPISLTYLNIINEDIEKLYFFTTVSNSNEDMHMLLLKNQMQNVINSMENLKNFYDFVNSLQENLAAYKSQNLRDDNRIANIMASCVNSKYPTVQNITDLKSIVNEIGSDKIYQKIQTLRLSKPQLKHIKAVFGAFTIKLKSSCELSSGQMTISGYNVRMSDVVKIDCWTQAKNIQIFALNKVFIDCTIDKKGEEVQLFIFAPTWEVIGGPKIILDGKAGEPHEKESANPSSFNSENGSNGLPGLPGDPAGNFFGVGKRFINSEYLEIHANGGKGGPGQHGGGGAHGIPGDGLPESFFEPPKNFKDAEKYFKDYQFSYKILWSRDSVPFRYIEKSIDVYGKPAIKPSNGGNGGVGGIGGCPGRILINGLGKSVNIKTFNNSDTGLEGQGGHGGRKTLNGHSVYFIYKESDIRPTHPPHITYHSIGRNSGSEVPAGKDGKSGSNKNNQKYPTKLSLVSPYLVINSFKDFVRMNLFENIKELELRTIVYEIENDKQIKTEYNTLAFVKEFEGLENQFFQLRNKIDFVPFFESFLTRVEEFAKSEQILENKKVLNYIYTAALTKVFTLKKKRKGKTVVNLSKYLNTIETSVKEIHEAQHLQIIQNYRDDFNNTLWKKIREAEGFIKNKIEPEIDKLWEESDKQIKAIIDEINENKNATKDAIALLEKNKAKYRDIMQRRSLLFPLKLFAASLSFFGPIGAGVGSILTGAVGVAEGMLINNSPGNGPNKVPAIDPDLKLMSRVVEVLNDKPQHLGEKLTEVVLKLEQYERELLAPEPEKIKKRQTIVKLKTQLQEAMSRKTDSILVVLAKLKDIEEIGKNLTEFTNSEKDILEKEQKERKERTKRKLEDSEDKNKHEKSLLQIKQVQNLLNCVQVVFNFAKEIQNDEARMSAIDKQMSEYFQQLRDLEKMEQQVYDIIIPDLRQIEETINAVKNSINGSSHVTLDITKWTVRTTLKDVKSLLQKFTIKMSPEIRINLERYMEKIDEGFSILIDIYDRIDSYLDSVKQAEYIANIVSASMTDIQITNPQLRNAVIDLKLIIQSNILFGKYGIALHAFKQHFYPFAAHVLQKFELPTGMRFNDTEIVRTNIIEKILDMKNHIDESEATLGEYSKYIHEKKIFNSNSTGSSPFYVWKHDTIKDEVLQLLNGSEIVIKADISEGLFYNSIKYNDIGINFKLTNDTLQNSIISVLKNFKLIMTMIGNNYYRCGERYYFISFDDDITISYTLKQDEGKNWIDPNKVYTTIRDSHTFLSPYVMWSIKLESINDSFSFNDFNIYVNETIDLELIGRGYYIEQHPHFNFEVCNEYLESFYNIENISKELV